MPKVVWPAHPFRRVVRKAWPEPIEVSVGRGGCALGNESSGTGSAALVALKNAWMGTSAPPGQRSRQMS